MDSVGAEIDCDVKAVFHEAEILVAGSVKGFDTGVISKAFLLKFGADLRQDKLVLLLHIGCKGLAKVTDKKRAGNGAGW